MSMFDLAGTGYTPGMFGGDIVTPEASSNGVFDYLERGVGILGNGFATYLQLTGKNPQTPERQTEYDYVPRDITGPVVTSQGFALSWQLVAFGALAFLAYTALHKA